MPPSPFSSLPPVAPDPVFGIAARAREAGPGAIDGSVGILLAEDGAPLLFPSVARALKEIGASLHERSHAYPPLLGTPPFRAAVARLLFPRKGIPCAGIAATGGTGALAILLRLLKRIRNDIPVILPIPTWANHTRLCAEASLPIVTVPYRNNGVPDVSGILDAARSQKGSTGILLQSSCHNPTGQNFTQTQWEELADGLSDTSCIVCMDTAYQGLGEEPEEDAMPLSILAKRGIPLLVAWSAAKNHGIYGERCGFACAVTRDTDESERIEGHFQQIARGLHSAAPIFGQIVVTRVQETYGKEWRGDLREARVLLQAKRAALAAAIGDDDYARALSGSGLFALLPLSLPQIETLRTAHKVFLTDDGRINVGGIPMDRMEELGHTIRSVLTK